VCSSDLGQFREDLYFRLNTISVDIPPLRQRQEEIPCLTHEFIARHNASFEASKTIAPEAMAALQAYNWPGNVRELRHVIERALVLTDDDTIDRTDLPPEIRRAGLRRSPISAAPSMLSLTELERRHIGRVLAAHGHHRARVAQVLGISERSLYRKLREYHLEATASDPEEDDEGADRPL
jgi:transcriptional regulator with PAS, ATPase and Fis domain